MSYYQAVAALAPYVYSKAPASSVPNIAFWQDTWPGARQRPVRDPEDLQVGVSGASRRLDHRAAGG